jgi:hypothetical protein
MLKLSSQGVAIAIALTGCASVTDVVSTGPETYLVASQGVIGNGSGAVQKADALKAANAYCTKKSKLVRVLDAKTEEPHFGKAPSAEVSFRCE